MSFRKKYDGTRPLGGFVVQNFEHDGDEYELWDLCLSVRGMHQFKLLAKKPMQHKANWFLVGRGDDLNESRDAIVMKQNTPALYELTKKHIVEHVKNNINAGKKHYNVSLFYSDKEELKNKLKELIEQL